MINIEVLKNKLPDFARDIKLNLASILSTEGAPDLNQKQIYSTALSAALSTKCIFLIECIEQEASKILLDSEIQAAKASATIMAMNNVYYRFVHFVQILRSSVKELKIK